MTKLYEISEEFKALAEMADDEDMALAVADTLEGVQAEFNDKAKAISSLVLNMSSDVTALDNEIERLAKKKKAIVNRQESLKDYLRENMERCDISKISCPLFNITLVKGREIVFIDNEKAIPDDYLTVKTVISPDKTAIANALKEGNEVTGAHLERAKSAIRIK